MEFGESDTEINIKELFEISANDYDIILTKTYVNGTEAESIYRNSGYYKILLQVYYSSGVVEKEIKVEIYSVSDNTSIDLFANGKIIAFTENYALLNELNYNDNLELTGLNFNSRAQIQIQLNGTKTKFGNMPLKAGENSIIITVTAESGRSEIYHISVTKKVRKLPAISAPSQTVRLSKYQNHINVLDYFNVTENDYKFKTTVLYDSTAIDNNILEVENISKIYKIEIDLTGEFGTISEFLELGVIAYSEIEIKFRSSSIVKENTDYIFSDSDFIDEIIYYGIDGALCKYKIFCNGEPFKSTALLSDSYYVTVEVWKDDILYAENSRWFTIDFSDNPIDINVYLLNSQSVIPEKIYNADINEYFSIDYGKLNPNDFIIRFIYRDSDSPQRNFVLKKGQNHFSLQIIEKLTERQFFIDEYTITCTYAANSESIFSSLKLNNRSLNIEENTVLLQTTTPVLSVKTDYTLNSGYNIINLPEEITLLHGQNTVEFLVRESDGSSYTGKLIIYNLGTLSYYLNSVDYEDTPLQADNKMILPEGTELNIDNLNVNYNYPENLEINKEVTKLASNIYDVTINAYFNSLPLGSNIFRIYIGQAQPRLNEIIAKVSGTDIIYYGINEYSLEIFTRTNSDEINFSISFGDSKYSAETRFTVLNAGINRLNIIIKENDFIEFTYDLLITVFPVDIISKVSYDGDNLVKLNNNYILDYSVNVNQDLVEISFNERLYNIDLTLRSDIILYNDECVGIKYYVVYKNINITDFNITKVNNNTTVNCFRDGALLPQKGNNLFTDYIRIKKSTANGNIHYSYFLECVYPLTTISGQNFIFEDGVGYFVNVDLSYIAKYASGKYTHSLTFDAISVSSVQSYTIEISVELYEVNQTNAALTITIDDENHIYLEEADLSGIDIIVKENVTIDIFTRNVSVKINGTSDYSIYDGYDIVESLTVSPKYSGNQNQLEFYVGLTEYNLIKVIIPVKAYTDENGNIIETACKIGGQEIFIYEDAETTEILYNGETFAVSIANKAINIPYDTSELYVEIYGTIIDECEFLFKDNYSGNSGYIEINDGNLLLICTDGEDLIPYAVINLLYF